MYRIVYAGIEHSDASPINFRYDDMMILEIQCEAYQLVTHV